MKLTKKQTLILLIISILANIAYRIYTNDWSFGGNSFFVGFTYGWIGGLILINSQRFFTKENTEIS